MRTAPLALRGGIGVKLPDPITGKGGDSRSKKYVEEHGDRCWEADILSPTTIQAALDSHINGWLDADLWQRRKEEIERARSLL